MLQLGAIDFGSTPGFVVTGKITRTMPNPKLLRRQSPYMLQDAQLANVLNGFVEWQIPLRIFATDSGATPDDLAAKLGALNSELTAESNTLTDSLVSGAAAITYATVKSPPLLAARDVLAERRHLIEDTITIWTAATATGPRQTLSPHTVSGIGSMSLGNLLGDAPAPLDLIFTPTWSGNGTTYDLSDLYVGVLPAGATLGDYVLYSRDASRTSFSLASASQAYDSRGKTTTTKRPGDWAVLNFGVPNPVGRFRVLVRAHSDGSACSIGLAQGGTSEPYEQLKVTSTAWNWYDLAEFYADGYTTMQVLGNTKGTLHVDTVVLMPVDDDEFAYETSNPRGHNLVVSVDMQYRDRASGSQDAARWVRGNGIVAPCNGRSLLVVVGDSGGSHPRGNCTVACSYLPRYFAWYH